MTSAYPMTAIGMGAAAAYVVSTLMGTLLARAGFPVTPRRQRVGCLDGLRGYLAISVLISHFIIWLQITRLGGAWLPPSVYILSNIGAGSVALFFMITGCVFYPRVLAGFRRTSWPAIYISRIFRIIPLILASVTIIAGIIVFRGKAVVDQDLPGAVLAWVTSWGEPPLLGYPDSGRMNAYVLWSLWYEWVFYIFILPLCALAMDLVRGRWPSWTVPVGLLMVGLVLRRFPALGLLPKFLPLFAIGMLAFECQSSRRLRSLLAARWVSGAAFLALVTGLSCVPNPYGLLPNVLLGFFLIAAACGNGMAGVLRTQGALCLGECSYGIYLLHGIVLELLFVDAAPALAPLTARQLPLVLPLATLVICLLTPATYLLIERPSIRAGHSLARRWTARTATTAPRLGIAP